LLILKADWTVYNDVLPNNTYAPSIDPHTVTNSSGDFSLIVPAGSFPFLLSRKNKNQRYPLPSSLGPLKISSVMQNGSFLTLPAPALRGQYVPAGGLRTTDWPDLNFGIAGKTSNKPLFH